MPPKRGRGRGRGAPRAEQPAEEQRRREEERRPPPQRQQQRREEEERPPPPRQGKPAPEIYRPPAARGKAAPPAEFREPQRHAPPPAEVREPQRRAPPPAEVREPQRRAPLPSAQQAAAVSSPTGTEKITEAVAGLSFEPAAPDRFHMAKRPGFGRNGIRIGLIANYFLLNYKELNFYHYDVDIVFLKARGKDEEAGAKTKGTSVVSMGRTAKEDAEKKVSHVEHQLKRAVGKQRCRQVISQMLLSERLNDYFPVYDGQKNIYTVKPFPFTGKKTFTITLEEEDRYKDFQVVIQAVEKQGGGNAISTGPLSALYEGRTKEIPQEVIMVFDTVMNHRNPPLTQCHVGRSFFLLDQRPYRLGEGLEIWFGYNQSVHLTQRGPAVIVNFSAKAFHMSGSVIDYACDLFNTDITRIPQMNRSQIRMLADKLKKVKIQVIHMKYPRKYTVKNVTDQAARDLRLNIDGKDTTVAKYFQVKYKQLRFPHLPCLHMQSTNKTTYLPLEVCEIVPNQPVLGKLSGQRTADMIKQTAIPPAERFSEISNQVRDVKKYSTEAMEKFGLLMDIQFMKLEGRVIPAPSLTYRDTGKVIQPEPTGKWRMDGKQFYRAIDGCSWIIISFSNERFCPIGTLERFAETLCRSARSVGLHIEMPRDIKIFDYRVRTYDALKAAKDMGVTFAVVVLSSRDNAHSYEEVKFVGDIQLRLITQCMEEKVVVKKFNPQVATNVLLKVNSKVGGVNHSIAQRHVIFSRPVIIMGADAAHSPRGYSCPSIAAVVGSLDAFPSQYAVACRTQSNPDEKKLSQEIILDLKNMVRHILAAFLKNTRGKRPEKVVFFRDGVSEGQFNVVLQHEIEMVQKACYEELGEYVPPLTFIVVQKRHQTRFRPQNPRDGIGRMGNVPPGTTVDTDVVHPVFFDFFICSHEGIQGTSKPAHYTVLYDDNNFTADELQQLCYHLCHMYARCNRSISIPAPVMYAHLACARAKKYADFHLKIAEGQSVASSGSSGEPKLPEHVEKAINNMGDFVPGMFYV